MPQPVARPPHGDEGQHGDIASSPVRDLLALTTQSRVISFAGGLPAPELFDVDGWRTAFAHALDDVNCRRNLQYAATGGNPELRSLLAQRLTGRGHRA